MSTKEKITKKERKRMLFLAVFLIGVGMTPDTYNPFTMLSFIFFGMGTFLLGAHAATNSESEE